MKLEQLREIYAKVNDDFQDGVVSAEIAVDLARYTKTLEDLWTERKN